MKRIFIILLLGGLFHTVAAAANSNDFRLFGRVSTVDNQSIEGYITWGSRKMFWIDFFEATKPNNPYSQYFDSSDGILFNNQSTPPIHAFICRFGNIKKIRITGIERIELELKGGNSISLKKGSTTDIGTSVTIHNGAETTILKWDKISEIEFMPSNLPANDSYNVPITGVVQSEQGLYKGFVIWDNDERILENTIDGKSPTGDLSIAFRNISKIEKRNNSCQLTLTNGRETELWGTNDVNTQNRGVSVNMPNVGSVSMNWSNFKFLETVGISEINNLAYDDFKQPQRLYGEVQTRKGKTIKGTLVYDLDEAMDCEVLDGKNNNINYRIPFRYVRSIEPKNYKYSFITLRNGNTLSLGDSADVSNENSGIIVFGSDDLPVYIPWEEVKLVTFQ